MRRVVALMAVFALVFAACGGGEDESEGTTEATVVIDGNNSGSGDGSDGGSSDGSGDGNGDDGDGSEGPDDDDFGDIVGNPDLDADDLPGQAGDLADDIDDIVSIGDCEAVGLMATAPETMQCRVLDQSIGGMDGFTMFNEGNDFNISIGTPSGLGEPCALLQACDQAEPIELSDNFPDTMIVELFGTVTIWGYHATGAELIVTKIGALSDEELQILMDVLDSVVETG